MTPRRTPTDGDTRRRGEVLAAIARQEDLNGRIRRNVMDTRRAVSFMMRSKMLNAEQFEEAAQDAKKNCPVSQALTGTTITLEASLVEA